MNINISLALGVLVGFIVLFSGLVYVAKNLGL